MSLAPTLITERNVSPAAGLVLVSALAQYLFTNVVTPQPASAGASGLSPSVLQTAGPTASALAGLSRFNPLVPTLLKTVIVYPELPATPSSDNDMTPTILLGNSSSAGIPDVGYVSTGGLVPTLLRDNAAFAFIPAPSPIVAEGLVPTVSLPAGQEGTTAPRLGTAQATELAPTILGELVVSADVGGITVTGLVPRLAYSQGWRTVALSGDAVWTDVPRAS